MNQEIQPTQQNNNILTDVIQTKVNKAMKDKYPTAEDIVEGLPTYHIILKK